MTKPPHDYTDVFAREMETTGGADPAWHIGRKQGAEDKGKLSWPNRNFVTVFSNGPKLNFLQIYDSLII